MNMLSRPWGAFLPGSWSDNLKSAVLSRLVGSAPVLNQKYLDFYLIPKIKNSTPRAVPLSSASIDVLKKLPASDHPSGHRVAIEIERSIKTIKRYEAIFAAYLQMIKQGDYAIVHYVCPDAAFAPRLSRLFQLIQAVPVVGERVPITDKHRARFPVYALQNWPPVASGMDISIG